MSFDIFLMCVRDGEEATFKRALVDDIMGRGAVNPRFPLTSVDYVDGGSDIYGANRGEDIDHLMFNHFGGETFWNRLWELLDRSGSFLTWPGDRCIAVTRVETLQHIYPGAAEHFGPPFIVRNGKELEDAVREEIDPKEPSEN